MQELQLAGVPVVGLRSVDIRRFSYNLTLAVFTGESKDKSTANLTKIYVSDKGKDELQTVTILYLVYRGLHSQY